MDAIYLKKPHHLYTLWYTLKISSMAAAKQEKPPHFWVLIFLV